MRKWRAGLRRRMAMLVQMGRKHGGRIAYYGGIAAALCAIALAAGEYKRGEDGGEEALLLPDADLSMAMEMMRAEPELSLPEDARVLRGYSGVPEWNGELGQWEAHTGVDIAFAEDEASCLMDGEVVGLGRSGLWGGFVELKCGERLFRYGSIELAEGLEIGAWLAAGERVGRADGSLAGEAGMERHVHLEIWEGENSVDFEALTAKIPAGD